MKVLVACEESQIVCMAFREKGHEAYSCDIQECSGGHPEWHIRGDARELLKLKWDLIIAHPPCTFLTPAGSCRLFNAEHQVINREREREGWAAKDFFMEFYNADCPHICVENPAPMHYWGLPPYSQIIEPYMFGHEWKKRTCLWLKGLPPLFPTEIVIPEGCWVYSDGRTTRTKLRERKGVRSAKERSKTFPGVARAMAEQWG